MGEPTNNTVILLKRLFHNNMPSRWVEDYSQLGVRYPIQQHPLSKIFPVVYQDQLFMHPILLKAPHLIPKNRHQRAPDSLNAGNTLASRVSATATPYVTDSTAREPLQSDKHHWWDTGPALLNNAMWSSRLFGGGGEGGIFEELFHIINLGMFQHRI